MQQISKQLAYWPQIGCLQAIENGDAVTLGQAWRDVRSGNVKPDDIDTLNTLLKSVLLFQKCCLFLAVHSLIDLSPSSILVSCTESVIDVYIRIQSSSSLLQCQTHVFREACSLSP